MSTTNLVPSATAVAENHAELHRLDPAATRARAIEIASELGYTNPTELLEREHVQLLMARLGRELPKMTPEQRQRFDCPSWCIERHSDFDSTTMGPEILRLADGEATVPAGSETLWHGGETYTVAHAEGTVVIGLAAESYKIGAEVVTGLPAISLDGDQGTQLTAAEARKLAANLLGAAERLDRIEGKA